MRAGRKKTPLILQEPTESTDSFGQVEVTYSDVDGTHKTIWSHVRNTSSEQTEEGDGMLSRDRYMVTTAWRSDITYKHRLKLGARIFEIEGINNVDERNHVLELDCVEMGE